MNNTNTNLSVNRAIASHFIINIHHISKHYFFINVSLCGSNLMQTPVGCRHFSLRGWWKNCWCPQQSDCYSLSVGGFITGSWFQCLVPYLVPCIWDLETIQKFTFSLRLSSLDYLSPLCLFCAGLPVIALNLLFHVTYWGTSIPG